MNPLIQYINEALPLNLAKEYTGYKRSPEAQKYMGIFWKALSKYAVDHGGKISRNGYRIYLPYWGREPEVVADDDGSSGSFAGWVTTREAIKVVVSVKLEERDQWIAGWDYIGGTVDVAFKDKDGKTKVRPGQKIGKLLVGETIPTGKGDMPALPFFSNDPIRLGKSIRDSIKSKNLWVVISNHAYDIAGMSTDRNWTSCMNVIDGNFKHYVWNDIELGTLVAYIIDKNDTNIEHPFGRVLIKPYELERSKKYWFSFLFKKSNPIVYSPEVTVYSPYIGLKPIRYWLKTICEEIQDETGTLRSLHGLYDDNIHDDPDRQFDGRKRK